MTNEITSVSTTGDTESVVVVERTSDSAIKTKRTTIRVSNENTRLTNTIKIDVLNSETILTVIKNKIDSSILTLNKIYYVNADNVYEKKEATGFYLLASKIETYMPEGNGFALSTMLVLKRISSQINEKGSIKLL